jgi:nucleotide-binding universal stress UspA family protein
MPSIERILVGTDFSPTSAQAVALAADVARRLDAELVLLHVDELPQTAPMSASAIAHRERARGELDRSRRALEGDELRVQALLRPGDPAREILRIATSHGAAMIVVGTHGATARSALLLGSVADRVVRYATAPVLVVPLSSRVPDAIPPAPGGRGGGQLEI